MSEKEYERHPLSAKYEPYDMSPETFRQLQVSISAGFDERRPVMLYEGKILDGWHRYRAAKGLVKPVFEKFAGTLAEAKAYVVSTNIHRSMTPSQRVAAALEVEAYTPPGAPAIPKRRGQGKSDTEVAEDLGVSRRTVVQYRAVQREGTPEVRDAVVSGEISVKRAAEIVKLPKTEQNDAVATARDKSHEKPSAGKTTKVPKPRKKPEVTPPTVGITKEAYDEVLERNQILTDEYDRMERRLAVHFMEGTEDEKARCAELLEEQAKRIAELEVEVKAVRTSRDVLQNENAQMVKQMQTYRTQLQKFRPASTPPAADTGT